MSRTRFGLTWWGRRWIASLEALGAAYANRLPRGRTYARKGTVSGLVLGAGRVGAEVAGSRPAPYRVTISLPAFTDDQWDAAVAALAGQVRQAAALLGGRMPDDIDEVLATAGLSLFPRPHELSTACSCPDVANPCKHVAAVHYVLAQAFDDDPFLLPALRGRDRAALLEALRTARRSAGGAGPGDRAAAPHRSPGGNGDRAGGRAPGGTRGRGPAAGAGDGRPGSRARQGDRDGGDGEHGHDGGDRAATVAVASFEAATLFRAPGDLAGIALRPRRADDPTALLRRLGPPPVGAPGPAPGGEDGDGPGPPDLQATLGAAVTRAAARAAGRLWSEQEPAAPPDRPQGP